VRAADEEHADARQFHDLLRVEHLVQLGVDGVEPRGIPAGVIERQLARQPQRRPGAAIGMIEVRERALLDRLLGEPVLGGLDRPL
jgi:hypothetical protein